MTTQPTTKKAKKVGVLRFRSRNRRYQALCNGCFKSNYYFSNGNEWDIRDGDLGDFRQQCEYCNKELNPKASPTMPELFCDRKYLGTWDDYVITRPRLPAPSTIERICKDETVISEPVVLAAVPSAG